MNQEIEAKATIEVPSSKDSQEETQAVPQAETVIRAAVETGAAAQAAETAAEQATEAANESRNLLEQLRESIKPEMEAIHNRLQALEAETEEESITPDEEEDTLTVVSAETVTLEEPPKAKEEIRTKQSETQNVPKQGGGFLRRIFLNM